MNATMRGLPTFVYLAAGALLTSCGSVAHVLQTPLVPQSLANTRSAQSGDLLYISNYVSEAVKLYAWPKLTHINTLRGFTHQDGLCTDANGDVFVANTNANNILEYAHGGTRPIATLADLPKYYPNFCAVDPTTGDLAVTNFPYGPYASVTGNLVIYHHAKGTPKAYTSPSMYYYYLCGYDDNGNLVVDGSSSQAVVTLVTLRHGSSALKLLTLDQKLAFPGGVQWDGRHWAIGDQRANIYQFDIKGTKGMKVGTTVLNGADGVYGFYIANGKVVAPELGADEALVFAYPAGGSSTMTITNLHQPVGAVISRGK
jgi:hypothetical protein